MSFWCNMDEVDFTGMEEKVPCSKCGQLKLKWTLRKDVHYDNWDKFFGSKGVISYMRVENEKECWFCRILKFIFNLLLEDFDNHYPQFNHLTVYERMVFLQFGEDGLININCSL